MSGEATEAPAAAAAVIADGARWQIGRRNEGNLRRQLKGKMSQ